MGGNSEPYTQTSGEGGSEIKLKDTIDDLISLVWAVKPQQTSEHWGTRGCPGWRKDPRGGKVVRLGSRSGGGMDALCHLHHQDFALGPVHLVLWPLIRILFVNFKYGSFLSSASPSSKLSKVRWGVVRTPEFVVRFDRRLAAAGVPSGVGI